MKRLCLAILMLSLSVSRVYAQDPSETGRNDPALLLAQALIAEAGWVFHQDHKVIPWVLYRRSRLPAFRNAPNPEVAVLLRYASAFRCYGQRCDNDRRRRMRALTWDVIETKSSSIARLARNWFSRRRHPDPCPRAWHWGGSDLDSTSLNVVDCGRTTNTYLSR